MVNIKGRRVTESDKCSSSPPPQETPQTRSRNFYTPRPRTHRPPQRSSPRPRPHLSRSPPLPQTHKAPHPPRPFRSFLFFCCCRRCRRYRESCYQHLSHLSGRLPSNSPPLSQRSHTPQHYQKTQLAFSKLFLSPYPFFLQQMVKAQISAPSLSATPPPRQGHLPLYRRHGMFTIIISLPPSSRLPTSLALQPLCSTLTPPTLPHPPIPSLLTPSLTPRIADIRLPWP